MDSAQEIMIQGYLQDNQENLVDLHNDASSELRESIEDMDEFQIECRKCDNKMLYSEVKGIRFCPFCDIDG